MLWVLVLGCVVIYLRRVPAGREKRVLACLASGPRSLDELRRELGDAPWLIRVLFTLRGRQEVKHVYPEDFREGEIRYALGTSQKPAAF